MTAHWHVEQLFYSPPISLRRQGAETAMRPPMIVVVTPCVALGFRRESALRHRVDRNGEENTVLGRKRI